MTYLERDFGMPPTVVNNLHELTDMVLERLEEPERDGPWDRRGMVVCSVQSGKTANYTDLVCKAVDAEYKLVIILAGIHSNLRSQTQLRIDEGVLGFVDAAIRTPRLRSRCFCARNESPAGAGIAGSSDNLISRSTNNGWSFLLTAASGTAAPSIPIRPSIIAPFGRKSFLVTSYATGL